MTPAQQVALKWLREHGGDAVFDRNGIALAQGETAQVMRSTWNALRDAGKVEFYGGARDGGRGYGRLRVVPLAKRLVESETGCWSRGSGT